MKQARLRQTVFHLISGIQACVCLCVPACVFGWVCLCTQGKKGAGREEDKNVREARLKEKEGDRIHVT